MDIPQTRDPFLLSVERLLNTYMSNSSFNVAELTQKLQSNRMQLYRKIKVNTGLSPSGYIRFKRLQKAADLLSNSNASISSISDASGFSKPAYFSKCFKDQYGCTPSEFIKEYRIVPTSF